MLAKYFQLDKYPEYNTAILRHNLANHFYEGTIFLFATSFISVNTVLPVFIQSIGGNAIAIGSVTVLWTLGLNLPQLFFIRLFKRRDKIKPGVMKYGLIYRLNFILISFVCSVFLGKMDSRYSVPLMLFLIFTAATYGSSSGLFWYDFFSKTTPIVFRGRLLAIRLFLGSALGILGGSAVSIILSSIIYPHNFALLFLICFFLTMVSFYFISRLIEPAVPEESGSRKTFQTAPVPLKEIFSSSKKILKENLNFKNFLVADALTLMSLTASAFYPVYAIKKFGLPASYAGAFTIILMASQVLGNFLFGYLADFFGHKVNLLILAASSAAASLVAVLANNVLLYGVAVFFFTGCTLTLQGISRLAIVVEMCTESERPFYIGLFNSVTAPTILFGVIGGLLITIIGYVHVFFIYTLISLAAFFWLYKRVKEPRNLKIGQNNL